MFKVKSTVVEYGGRKFRLEKLDARSACYLAMKLAAVFMPMAETKTAKGAKNAINGANLAKVVSSIPREEFDEVQTIMLRSVRELEDHDGTLMPSPLLDAAGAFVKPEDAYNLGLILNLMMNVIKFNVGDFFTDAGLKKQTK